MKQQNKKYSITFDIPLPYVIPPNSSNVEVKPPRLPQTRQSVPHTPTNTTNVPSRPQSPEVNQITNNKTTANCNCGVSTGDSYSFKVRYKKIDSVVNTNTNQKRRDWLYLELKGNIDTNVVKTSKILIYLK